MMKEVITMEVLSHGNFVLWEWFVHQGPEMLDSRIIENLLNLSGQAGYKTNFGRRS